MGSAKADAREIGRETETAASLACCLSALGASGMGMGRDGNEVLRRGRWMADRADSVWDEPEREESGEACCSDAAGARIADSDLAGSPCVSGPGPSKDREDSEERGCEESEESEERGCAESEERGCEESEESEESERGC